MHHKISLFLSLCMCHSIGRIFLERIFFYSLAHFYRFFFLFIYLHMFFFPYHNHPFSFFSFFHLSPSLSLSPPHTPLSHPSLPLSHPLPPHLPPSPPLPSLPSLLSLPLFSPSPSSSPPSFFKSRVSPGLFAQPHTPATRMTAGNHARLT